MVLSSSSNHSGYSADMSNPSVQEPHHRCPFSLAQEQCKQSFGEAAWIVHVFLDLQGVRVPSETHDGVKCGCGAAFDPSQNWQVHARHIIGHVQTATPGYRLAFGTTLCEYLKTHNFVVQNFGSPMHSVTSRHKHKDLRSVETSKMKLSEMEPSVEGNICKSPLSYNLGLMLMEPNRTEWKHRWSSEKTLEISVAWFVVFCGRFLVENRFVNLFMS